MGQRINKIDRTGQRFGRLTVIRLGACKSGRTSWVCECDCGNQIDTRADGLTGGRTQSCGCLMREKAAAQGASKRLDLTGQRFGRLVVLRPSPNKSGHSRWSCLCDCGNVTTSSTTDSLRNGTTLSCGCLSRERAREQFKSPEWPRRPRLTHGMAQNRSTGRASTEYTTWTQMIQRCTNPANGSWSDYGGRGIKVCDRWRESFEAFYEDMGPRPADPEGWTARTRYWTLDRIDVDGNYESDNCRWADWSTQRANQRRSKPVA